VSAHLSTLPRIAVTGAIASSSRSTSGLPTSPACTIASQPARAAFASGRSSPWVSEMTPTIVVIRLRLAGLGRIRLASFVPSRFEQALEHVARDAPDGRLAGVEDLRPIRRPGGKYRAAVRE